MKRIIPKTIRSVLYEARDELVKIYSGRLRDVILFGSYARGEDEPGSDIDIALILDHAQGFLREHERYFPVVSRLSLAHDTVISVVPIDADDYASRKSPLILNIMNEGIRV